MFSVFSNFLQPLQEANLVALTDESKPSEIYDWMRIAYNQGSPGILTTMRLVCPRNEDEDDYDIFYELWQNKAFKKWLAWVNENITLAIGVQDYRRIGTCLHIADSMLMKAIDEGKIARKFYDPVHYYLCKNAWDEHRLVVNEGLPF